MAVLGKGVHEQPEVGKMEVDVVSSSAHNRAF
jgi:hypothetical protein